MSNTTPSLRHREVVGAFSGGTLTPARQARDAVRPKPAPTRKRRTRDDTAARIGATAAKITRGVVTATDTLQRTTDSLDRLATGLRAIAEQRRATRWPCPGR